MSDAHIHRRIIDKLNEVDREGVYLGGKYPLLGFNYKQVRRSARRLVDLGVLVEYAPDFYCYRREGREGQK